MDPSPRSRGRTARVAPRGEVRYTSRTHAGLLRQPFWHRLRPRRHRLAPPRFYCGCSPVCGLQVWHGSMSGSTSAIIASSRLMNPNWALSRPHPPRCGNAASPDRFGRIFHDCSARTRSRAPRSCCLDLQLPDPAPDLTQLPLQPGRPGPSRRRRGCCPGRQAKQAGVRAPSRSCSRGTVRGAVAAQHDQPVLLSSHHDGGHANDGE